MFLASFHFTTKETKMTQVHNFHAGRATGVMIDGTVHVLKRSSSRYRLQGDGQLRQYCCLGSCCDGGLHEDVQSVVEQAKARGASRIVIRPSQRDSNNRALASLGLEVRDVGWHPLGRIADGWEITDKW